MRRTPTRPRVVLACTAALLLGGRPARAQPAAPAAGAAAADTATVFAPGVISDAREQWRLTFTPDGRTAYFAASDGFFPVTRRATIYVAHRRGDGWSTPEVAPFSGTHADIDPFVTPDGRRLYFASIRPVDGVARGDVDLWMVERSRDGWGPPTRLGDAVNSPADELYPSASRDGTLYFASGPRRPEPGAHFDIYRAARSGRGFAARARLDAAVNTAPGPGGGPQDAWDFNPEISPDGRTLVFTSLRPGGAGLGDLYVSRRRGGRWTPARPLGPRVNTAADEYHPTLSRDGGTLYFVRRRAGAGDFHRIATRGLPGF